MAEEIHLYDFVDEFAEALKEHLRKMESSTWGDTWLHRPIQASEGWAHQVDRLWFRLKDYYDQWRYGGEFPYLRAAGGILINWVRLQHPELSPHFSVDNEKDRA